MSQSDITCLTRVSSTTSTLDQASLPSIRRTLAESIGDSSCRMLKRVCPSASRRFARLLPKAPVAPVTRTFTLIPYRSLQGLQFYLRFRQAHEPVPSRLRTYSRISHTILFETGMISEKNGRKHCTQALNSLHSDSSKPAYLDPLVGSSK